MLPFFQRQLYLANSASYKGKQRFFYPLKHQLLQRYARKDGWDLQTITKQCWNCDGSGEHWTGNECYRCDGTGIYSQRTHYLQRWKLGDRVYHCPVEERPDGEPCEEIAGRIEHSHLIDDATGRKALIWLMARYQPRLLLKRWLVFQRYYRLDSWLNKMLIRLKLRDDDMPF